MNANMLQLNRWIAPLARRVRLMIGRAALTLLDNDPGLPRLQIKTQDGEIIGDVEWMQQYGLAANPLAGAEPGFVAVAGDRSHCLAFTVGDRRYRLVLPNAGDVALYDHRGQSLRLLAGGIEVHAPKGTAHFGDMSITGNLGVSGDASVGGMLTAANIDIPAGGDITIGGISFNTHVHGGVQPGTGVSGGPQ